jgi:hypothetical protein
VRDNERVTSTADVAVATTPPVRPPYQAEIITAGMNRNST